MTSKFNAYSYKYYSFIKDNIKTNNIIDNNELLEYYNTVKSVSKKCIHQTNPIGLSKLRNDDGLYLVMESLKNTQRQTLQKHLSREISQLEINKLFNYLDDNDKKHFANWIVLHHRIIPTIGTIDKTINFSHDTNRKNLHTMLYDNPFVSLNIQSYYETHDILYTNYKSDGIALHLYEYNSMPKINPTDVFHIINVMRKLSNKNVRVKIVILGSPFKKKLFNAIDDDITLLPIHINSGSTLRDSYINIWRYEEWQKVLIHEMIHYLEIDFNFRTRGFNNLTYYLSNKFNVIGNVIPSEAYTEMIAVILHTMYISSNFKSFSVNFMYETNFSLFQVAKILDFIGASELDDIDKTIKPESEIILKQKTSILSYYIVKSSLLFNLVDMINFVSVDVTFNNRMNEFINLVQKSLSNSQFKAIIKEYIEYIKNTKDKSNSLYTTMRMTCLQTY